MTSFDCRAWQQMVKSFSSLKSSSHFNIIVNSFPMQDCTVGLFISSILVSPVLFISAYKWKNGCVIMVMYNCVVRSSLLTSFQIICFYCLLKFLLLLDSNYDCFVKNKRPVCCHTCYYPTWKKKIIFVTKTEYYFLNLLFICYMCMLSHVVCWNQSNSIGKAFCWICPGQIPVSATWGSRHKESLFCEWSLWNQIYPPQSKPFSVWSKYSRVCHFRMSWAGFPEITFAECAVVITNADSFPLTLRVFPSPLKLPAAADVC